MVRPRELVPGNCYFTVRYQDERLLFPIVQTLQYVCVELSDQDGTREWVFHDLGDLSLEPDEAQSAQATPRWVFPDDQLYMILDCAGLIRKIKEVAFDHPINPPNTNGAPASKAELRDLRHQIVTFFQTPEIALLTVSIVFTSEGLSLCRLPDGTIQLFLSADPREDPETEARLREVCHSAGFVPLQDYLADKGRTRILTYPVGPEATEALMALAESILADAFKMESGDILRYHVKSKVECD